MNYLDQLLTGLSIVASEGDLHLPITGITADSRKVRKGFCFVAVRGFKENGMAYAPAAAANGAAAIVYEAGPADPPPKLPGGLPWVATTDARLALARMNAAFYGNISDHMYLVGVTGTNGKTTVTALIHAILGSRGKTARIGTLGMECGGLSQKTSLTTPEAPDIFEFLVRARKDGCQNLVMEVSSVGLKLKRVEPLHFRQGIFTTFSGDHLDFHHTMADYLDSKLMLFRKLTIDDWAVVNIDDPKSVDVIDQLQCRYLTYGFSDAADVRPVNYRFSTGGIETLLHTPRGRIQLESPLLGRVNLSNIMAATASAIISGIPLETIREKISGFRSVKGRLDMVHRGDISVLIDYAHTDRALEAMLQSLREIAPERIILVFGAGGSRDKTKRPRMGETASRNADFLIVTSDNPRDEDPMEIINQVTRGFTPGFAGYIAEPDRAKAISKALSVARPGDLVVVAGKGHEDYQQLKDRTIHFDDYEVVKGALEALKTQNNEDIKG